MLCVEETNCLRRTLLCERAHHFAQRRSFGFWADQDTIAGPTPRAIANGIGQPNDTLGFNFTNPSGSNKCNGWRYKQKTDPTIASW